MISEQKTKNINRKSKIFLKLPGKKVAKLYRIANCCHVFSGLKQKKHTCWVKSIKMYTNKKASHFCEAFHNL